jgi:hypothetical protein
MDLFELLLVLWSAVIVLLIALLGINLIRIRMLHSQFSKRSRYHLKRPSRS